MVLSYFAELEVEKLSYLTKITQLQNVEARIQIQFLRHQASSF